MACDNPPLVLDKFDWRLTMTAIASHKDYCLAKYRDKSVPFLINRKLLIHKQLERPSRTYVVYSDLHGSYEKYTHWLKYGLGYYRIAISEILGSSYSANIYHLYEKLFLVVHKNRINAIKKHIEQNLDGADYDPKNFFSEPVPRRFLDILKELEQCGLSRRRILADILTLLRLITRGDEHRIIKVVPSMFLENVLKLYFKQDRSSYNSLVQGIVDSQELYPVVLSIVVKIALMNMFDKHINLGDTYDRGDSSDKLINLYKAYFGPATDASPLHYIWGNHDILWLGAAIGNPIMAVTALRVSLRYNNVAFLGRYGFNLEHLRAFANKCYKNLPTGEYCKAKEFRQWSQDEAIKMVKVLLVLESKLTVTCLKEALEVPGEIDYQEYYHHYLNLLKKLPTDIEDDPKKWQQFISDHPLYTDAFFPTVNKQDPSLLTAEEQQLVNEIVEQFTTLPRLQSDIKWLSRKGETYRVMDNTLYYHAALPAQENMELTEVKGLSGKRLLDYIQRDLKRIFETHRNNQQVTIREKMFLWYLWCGATSPFFCKDKMATLERAIFDKEQASSNPLTTWKEIPNPYYQHIRNDLFLNKILTEFHANKLCMGHTPIKSAQQGILSENVRAFIIDGGASEAYGDRGVVLINTPDFTYLVQHPNMEELKKAEVEERHPDITITPLEENRNMKLRHMDKGYFLRREMEAIEELLQQHLKTFTSKYFY